MRRSRFPLIGLVGICLSIGSVTSSLLASERFDPVSVTTLPAGATVIVDGKVGGRTPLVVHLSRELVHSIRVELEGYLPRTAEVRPEIDWTELSRHALGGALIGVATGAVDVATGEAKKLTPAELKWTLERVAEVEEAVLPIVATGLSGL